MKGIFNENISPTVALEFGTKVIKLKNGVNIKVQIWDTGNLSVNDAIKLISNTKVFNFLYLLY